MDSCILEESKIRGKSSPSICTTVETYDSLNSQGSNSLPGILSAVWAWIFSLAMGALVNLIGIVCQNQYLQYAFA